MSDTTIAPSPPATSEVPSRRTHARWPRRLLLLVAAAAWVVVLFTVVFPNIETRLNTDPTLEPTDAPSDDPVIDGGAGAEVDELPGEG